MPRKRRIRFTLLMAESTAIHATSNSTPVSATLYPAIYSFQNNSHILFLKKKIQYFKIIVNNKYLNVIFSCVYIGAKVQVQCRARDNNTVTVKVKGVTNEDGGYSIDVAGDHADEICEVSALSSPDTKCNKPFTNGDKAAVSLTDIGVQGTCRYANPIGFKNSTALDPACEDVLIELNCVAAPCLPNGE
ncbi:OLC1v1035735C1 [Oldenlandia corymbosa var. corymbosa]|uniref:OLC1v1035735C1 n=1 Tax=Oldenlandia corymbosa var. corymbosa TaxID=529605 RepID=A0AAV1CU66_OLDCO|nr:OLC1v1035735C1 [Oldenlandia corymbosa var. corymbosa]